MRQNSSKENPEMSLTTSSEKSKRGANGKTWNTSIQIRAGKWREREKVLDETLKLIVGIKKNKHT